MTFLGWLIVLALIGFFALLIMRLGPIYLENYTVKMALESMENEPGLGEKTPSEVRYMFQQRMDMNYITRLTKDAVKIRREGGVTYLEVNYEVREPLLGNVDAVVTFKEKAELSRR
jgi:hypothetical protein